jgi:hypothetical protein
VRGAVDGLIQGSFGQFDRAPCTLCAPVHVIRLSREELSCAEVVCCSRLVVARKSISLLCDQGSHREVVSIWGPWPAAVRRPLGALREAAGERILGRPQHG